MSSLQKYFIALLVSCLTILRASFSPVCMGTKNIYKCNQLMSSSPPYLPRQPICAALAQDIIPSKDTDPCVNAKASWNAHTVKTPFNTLTCLSSVPSCTDKADAMYNNGNCLWAHTCYANNYKADLWVALFQECTSHHDRLYLTYPFVGWTILDESNSKTSMCQDQSIVNNTFCDASGSTGVGWNIYWQQCNTFSNIKDVMYNITDIRVTGTDTSSIDNTSLTVSIPRHGKVPPFLNAYSPDSISNFWVDIACITNSQTFIFVELDFLFYWTNASTNASVSISKTVQLKKECSGVSTSTPVTLTNLQNNTIIEASTYLQVQIPSTAVQNQTIKDVYISQIEIANIPQVQFKLGSLTFLSKFAMYISPKSAKFNDSVTIVFKALQNWAEYDKNFAVISGATIHGSDWRVESSLAKGSNKGVYSNYYFDVKDFSRQVYIIAKTPAAPYSGELKIGLNDWQLVMVFISVIVVVGGIGYMCRARQYDIRKTEYNAIKVAQEVHAGGQKG